jgi:hypothetical protein
MLGEKSQAKKIFSFVYLLFCLYEKFYYCVYAILEYLKRQIRYLRNLFYNIINKRMLIFGRVIIINMKI